MLTCTLYIFLNLLQVSVLIKPSCFCCVASTKRFYHSKFDFIYSTYPLKLAHSFGVLCFDAIICSCPHGPFGIYVNLRFVHAQGMPGTFSLPPRFNDPDTHHGTCLPGSLTSGFRWSRWREKPSWHSWRMRSPKFYISGMRPMELNGSLLAILINFWAGVPKQDSRLLFDVLLIYNTSNSHLRAMDLIITTY